MARLLPQDDLVNVEVDGPSSAGKSRLITSVLKMLPGGEVYNFTRISPNYLAYMSASLEHKIVFIQEADTLTDELTVQMVRSLLSEGRPLPAISCGAPGREDVASMTRYRADEATIWVWDEQAYRMLACRLPASTCPRRSG
jgi:hypothetical protein